MLWQLRYKGAHGLVLDGFIDSKGDIHQARRVAEAWCRKQSESGFGTVFRFVGIKPAILADDSILETDTPEPAPAAPVDDRKARAQDRRLARTFGEATEEQVGV